MRWMAEQQKKVAVKLIKALYKTRLLKKKRKSWREFDKNKWTFNVIILQL